MSSASPRQAATREHVTMRGAAPLSASTLFDRATFLVGAISAVWLAVLILLEGFRSWWGVLLAIVVWAVTAYLALPRLHRMLSDLYVPDYFFGRTRTADGLLGDPVNLGVDGSLEQLDAVMTEAGWHRADDITTRSTWGIIVSTLTRRSYPTAPVSPLMLFGRKQDVAYQQEVAGNPKQRHHVRFWHTPDGWLLPGGARVDWLGAGTYDTDVGLSLFTLQVTHRIDANTDIERDYVVSSATGADPAVRVRVLRDFTTGYHARNGGGDRFITDGDLPILELGDVEVSAAEAASVERQRRQRDRPPLTTVFGAVIVLISVVVAFVQLGSILGELGQASDTAATASLIVGILAAVSIGQVVLVIWMLRGGRASRNILVILMILSVLSVAIEYVDGTTELGLNLSLLWAALQCLALLALTTDSAGAWSRGDHLKRT